MSHNTKENLLFAIIIAIFVFIGGPKLWSFDRSATPSAQASWTLEDTKPVNVSLPSTILRPNRVDSDVQLRLYKETSEVVLYCPGTYRAYIAMCRSLPQAVSLYNEFSVRLSYYTAEDRTYADHKGKNSEVNAAEQFLNYMFKNLGDTSVNDYFLGNKYVDTYNVYMPHEYFAAPLMNFDPNETKRQHKYLSNNETFKMQIKLYEVYGQDVVKAKQWLLDERGYY